jgi:hypothetical protein
MGKVPQFSSAVRKLTIDEDLLLIRSVLACRRGSADFLDAFLTL